MTKATTPVTATTGDYARELHIGAAPDKVLAALTTLDGLTFWWAPASGSAAERGELRFTFDDPGAPLVLRVTETAGSSVAWEVTACPFLPDWVGTTVTFQLRPGAGGGCELSFRHVGLGPRLECFDQCRAGWDHYLPSLRDYLQSGAGRPFRRG